MFYCKFDEVTLWYLPSVSRMGSWVSKLLLLLCFLYCKMTVSITKMSGFLEVAINYTFHSPLCVRCLRLSGSSAHRRGTCGHRGREARKISFQLFSHVSFQTVPLPLSWFETHPRWPPVTQYAIVGLACEQSSYYHGYTLLEMHREREFLGKTIQTGSSRSVRNSCDRRNM